jgi:hypothetical protein
VTVITMKEVRMRFTSLVRLSVIGILACAALTVSVERADAEVYKATLIAPRGIRADKTAELTLTVKRFATEEDADRYEKILNEQGSEGLLETLRQQDWGVARVQGGMTCRINHVRIYEGKGGTKVIIVTEKPLLFPEDSPEVRSMKSFGFVQIDFAPDGSGRGTMAEAINISVEEDGSLQIQAYNAASIKMENVRQEN